MHLYALIKLRAPLLVIFEYFMTVQSISAEALQQNLKILSKHRAMVSLLSGAVAGILGLTNWSGFIFYLFPSALLSLTVMLKSRGTLAFPSPWMVWTWDLYSTVPSYLASWVFWYGVCCVNNRMG